MSKKKPKLNKLSVMVDQNNEVFIHWIDTLTSGTLTLTAEEAIELGRVGNMAYVRRTSDLPPNDYMIYAVATAEQMVPNAIEDGEWYGSLMAAQATADQLSYCNTDGPYKVYSVTIREEKYI